MLEQWAANGPKPDGTAKSPHGLTTGTGRPGSTMRYPGGKNGAGTFQQIINWMPPHSIYVEPFLGSGAVMRMKRPAAINLGIDLSRSAIAEFRPPLKLGRVLIGPCSLPLAGIGMSETKTFLTVGDGLSFLEDSAELVGDDVLIYCDPPYLHSTRTGRHLYAHEFSDQDHARLLQWATRAKCRVMISGYWSSLYGSTLRKWRCVSFAAITRGGSMKQECVWCNFPEPDELHDYSYLGSTWRERERIKRKKLRWTSRIRRMPLLERQALLSAIDELKGRIREGA
jgi:DNA adenine methylase